METEITERLSDLAQQFVWASGVKEPVKEAAKLRSQCTLEEWGLVVKEAKRIYAQRGRTR